MYVESYKMPSERDLDYKEKHIAKFWDDEGNCLSTYVREDGEIEMRYFYKNGGGSRQILRGMWIDAYITAVVIG